MEELSKDYLYFECISFINRVKCKASLAWHSPMLNDISGVKTWLKVNQGMMKMFRAEVLDKLPIMQHFLVGSTIGGDIVFPSETAVSGKSATLDDCEKRPAPLPIASAIPLPNPDKNTSQIIVKYVQGPDGRQIPIYGRLACSGHQHSHSGQHLDGENAPLDTFALGQEHPTCCGMRIPSAIAASMANQGKLLPFD